jgi:inorganic pyrophosphatase
MLRMEDRGEPDNKIIAVPSRDPLQLEYFDIADIPGHSLKEIEHFFSVYKDLEGERVHVSGWEKSEAAVQEVVDAMARYHRAFGDDAGR